MARLSQRAQLLAWLARPRQRVGPPGACRAVTVAGAVAQSWIEIVGATSLGLRPLAARERDHPRCGLAREVEHLQFELRRWDGRIGPWGEHFGKGRGQVKSLDDTEPLRSRNEVEVAKRLRTVRDHGFWFSGFSTKHVPDIWRPWVRECSQSTLPDWLARLDRELRAKIPSKAGGMPDVVAWNDRESLRSLRGVQRTQGILHGGAGGLGLGRP